MGRYIQAAVSDENHDRFTRFAGSQRMTLSDLVEIAVLKYIELKGKEDEAKAAVVSDSNI